MPLVCYNIDQKLRRFLQDPGAFREVQVECRAPIRDWKGSPVRDFFISTYQQSVRMALCILNDLA
jgi:hypothetical protein